MFLPCSIKNAVSHMGSSAQFPTKKGPGNSTPKQWRRAIRAAIKGGGQNKNRPLCDLETAYARFTRERRQWCVGNGVLAKMLLLDGPAIRNANRGDSRESIHTNRFTENPLFSECASDSREWHQTCDSQVLAPRSAIRKKKGVLFGNPETVIRKNQAIRANLQIDSRESGHLRCFLRPQNAFQTSVSEASIVAPSQTFVRKHLGCRKWGCNKWGFKGCLPALPGDRHFPALFALFWRVRRAVGKSRKRRKKGLYSPDRGQSREIRFSNFPGSGLKKIE